MCWYAGGGGVLLVHLIFRTTKHQNQHNLRESLEDRTELTSALPHQNLNSLAYLLAIDPSIK